jgi:hypothetical protein
MSTDAKLAILQRLLVAMHGVHWPDVSDAVGCTHGLLRAQSTYNLPPVEVARGKFRHHHTEARLSVDDCMKVRSRILFTRP